MSPGHLVPIVTKPLVKLAVDRLLGYVRGDQKALAAAWDELKEDLLFEMERQLHAVSQRCDGIDEKLGVVDTQRVFLATQFEAARSPGKDRIGLLAAAFAGYFRPDIEIDRRNRAFRVVQQLDPTDVVTLREASGFRGAIAEQKDPTSWDALAAGCIEIDEAHDGGEWFTHKVSDLGDLVLRFLETYEPPAKDPDATAK